MLTEIKEAAEFILKTTETNPNYFQIDEYFGWSCHALTLAYTRLYWNESRSDARADYIKAKEKFDSLRQNLANEYVSTVLEPKVTELDSKYTISSNLFITDYYNILDYYDKVKGITVGNLRREWLNWIINYEEGTN